MLVAPVAFQRVAHPDGEVAMARAAAAAGTIMCLSTFATATLAEVAADRRRRAGSSSTSRATPGSQPRRSSAGAPSAASSALVLTVDTPVLGRRERDLRTGFTIPHELGLDVGAGRRRRRRASASTRSRRR